MQGSRRPRSRAVGPSRSLHAGSDFAGREHDDRSRHSSRSSRDYSPDGRDRAAHGIKRSRQDDSVYGNQYTDPRRFKVHYEGSRGQSRREDHGRNGAWERSYQDRSDRGRGSRDDRTFSDTRTEKSKDNHRGSGPRDSYRHTELETNAGAPVVPAFGSAFLPLSTKPGVVPSKTATTSKSETVVRQVAPRDEQSSEPPAMDEDALIEQRRKRREMLRAKHSRETPLLQKALNASAHAEGAAESEGNSSQNTNSVVVTSPDSTALSTPAGSAPGSPLDIAIDDDAELANDNAQSNRNGASFEGPSAADYDPSMDMQEDRVGASGTKAGDVARTVSTKPVSDAAIAKGPTKNESVEFDMFADDVEDESPDSTAALHKDDGIQAVGGIAGKQLDKSLLDDWDDPEGYYRIILGEIIDKRYQIQTNLGKGVFSAVVRAIDNTTGQMVAIKIIRKQESMYKAGLKEIHTLEKLCEADPSDKKHVIRLERHFMHKGHLCMVFEHLSINLREVLKKFGRDVGINIRAVRAYAQQMFLGLSLLKKCDILHADLKPDNVLVNDNRSQLKIADLGSAFDVQDSEVTDILVSRFYRAPEIMLGIKGDFALDMWSIGCTLFELYTGRICFTGPTNNQMLKSILECRGKIPNRVLKRAEYWAQHFDNDGTFLSHEYDNVTRKEVVRRMNIVRPAPAKELRARLFANSKDLSVADAKELSLFADLLDRCLALDPLRRINPTEALRHGFINRTTTTLAKPPAKGQ